MARTPCKKTEPVFFWHSRAPFGNICLGNTIFRLQGMFEDDFPFSRGDILVLEGGMIAILVAIMIKFSFWMGE